MIDTDITIEGVDDPTLTGNGLSPVVRVRHGALVAIRHLTIQRGLGGGIVNKGRLTLEDTASGETAVAASTTTGAWWS